MRISLIIVKNIIRDVEMMYRMRCSTLDILLLCISFYEFTDMPHSLFLLIKYTIIAYLFFSHCGECKKMQRIVISILVYGGITFIATIVRQNMLNRYVASFVYMLHILTIYVTVSAFVRFRGIEDLIKCLTKILLALAIITDVPMLFINYNFSSPAEKYLIGNKFVVSYLHCFLIALLFGHYDEKKSRRQVTLRIGRVFFLLFSIIICIRVTCTTGMLICLFMGVMIYTPFPLKIKKFLSTPKVIIIGTAIINVLMLGSSSLLTTPYIASFISNVLGKSYTWVGRLHIYAMIFDVIRTHLWFGYGYFSNIIEDILGFGNAQNGVLKVLVDSGIIGLVGYTSLVYYSIKKSVSVSIEEWSLIAFVYCMVVASIVEINLTDYLFFLTIAMIFSAGQNKKIIDNRRYETERGKM